MNKLIWIVRHGESTANAGGITSDHKTITLSPRGQAQAQDLSLSYPEPPTLLITSPFDRTGQTAEPTIKKYPSAKCEVWPVEEFTYLSPSSCVNTTAAERKERRDEYWERCDPDYIDGEGAESFNMLLARAKTAIDRLSRLDEGFIVMFTHGLFMQAIWGIWTCEGESAKELMAEFKQLIQFGNCEILKWDENNYYFDINEICLEENLPKYLKHDLDALVEGRKINSSVLDCLWCEMQGSINSALVDRQITGKQANYLRRKYLWGEK